MYQIGNCIRQRSVAVVCKLCVSRRQPPCLQLPLGWNIQNNGELLLFLSAGSVYLDVCVMGRLGVVGLKLPFRLHSRYRGKANRHPLIIRYWPAMFSSSPWSLRGIKGVECRSTCPFTAQYRCFYITIKPVDCVRDNLHLRLHSLPAQYILRITVSFVINCKPSDSLRSLVVKSTLWICEAQNSFPKFHSLSLPISRMVFFLWHCDSTRVIAS